MATPDQAFISQFSVSSKMLAMRNERDARRKQEKLKDSSKLFSLLEQNNMISSADGQITLQNDFFAKTSKARELRKQLVNSTKTIKGLFDYVDSDTGELLPGKFGGTVELKNGNVAALNETTSGVEPITVNRSTSEDDPVVEMPPGVDVELGELALTELMMDINPSFIDMARMAEITNKNINERTRVDKIQKQADLIKELKNPKLNPAEKSQLVENFLASLPEQTTPEQTTMDPDQAVLDGEGQAVAEGLDTDIPVETTQEPIEGAFRGMRTGTDAKEEWKALGNYLKPSEAKQVQRLKKQNTVYRERIKKYTGDKNKKYTVNDSRKRLERNLDKIEALEAKNLMLSNKDLEGKNTTPDNPAIKKNEVPTREAVIAAATARIESGELEDAELQIIKDQRLQTMFEKNGIKSIADLITSTSIGFAQRNEAFISLSYKMAIDQSREFGADGATKIQTLFKSNYTSMFGALVNRDPNLTAEKLQKAYREEVEFDNTLEMHNIDLANKEKAAQDLRIKPLADLITAYNTIEVDGTVTTVREPKRLQNHPNRAAIKISLQKLKTSTKTPIQKLKNGETLSSADVVALESYAEAVVMVARGEAYLNRQNEIGWLRRVGENRSIIWWVDKPDLGEGDLQIGGSLSELGFLFSTNRKGEKVYNGFDFGDEMLINNRELDKILGDGSSQQIQLILADPRFQAAIKEKEKDKDQRAEN